MKGGKTKSIGKIKPGDKVEAGDPQSGRHEGPRTVLARLVHHDDDLIDLTVRIGHHHTSVLHTTSKHPFWDDTLHTWVPAGRLTPGHDLETATDHHIRVVSVRTLPGAADMYNLTVEELHTYYVLAGATPVLVHNSNGCTPFADGENWYPAFQVNGHTIEAMADVRASGGTLYLDDLMIFPQGTAGLSRVSIGPDALRDMKYTVAAQARAQGFDTVKLTYERHIPQPDGTILKRPWSMTLDVNKTLGEEG
jgi:hypothetical protein